MLQTIMVIKHLSSCHYYTILHIGDSTMDYKYNIVCVDSSYNLAFIKIYSSDKPLNNIIQTDALKITNTKFIIIPVFTIKRDSNNIINRCGYNQTCSR